MKIAVIGDLMLDQYDLCKNRDNPESSGPCYKVERTEYKPGGAGNVAANLAKLGADMLLIGALGEDENARVLTDSFQKLKIQNKTIVDKNRPTIVKQRILSAADGRYHFRLDREIIEEITENHTAEIINAIKEYDLIIVSDYRKGVVSQGLMDALRATGKRIMVDTKSEHRDFYKGVFMIKPNASEAKKMANMDDELAAAAKLKDELETNVLLTRGAEGISYFGKNGERYDFAAAAEEHEVVDITGAGDTVIATFAHFLAKDYPIQECVRLANKAAGIAVRYPGCYAVSEKEILGE